MSHRGLLLAVGLVLAASAARAEERALLVPEGEPEANLQEARWALMGSVGAVAFSPDGHTLASGGGDGRVRLWDVATGRELRRLEGHTDAVQSLAFSPDGSTLASGGKDSAVRLWDVSTGRELHRMAGHTDLVRSVAFSADGETLASGGGDKTVRLWDARTGRPRMTLEGPADPILSFTSSGSLVASGEGGNSLREWDASTGKELARAFAEASPDAPAPPSGKGPPQAPRKGYGAGLALQQARELPDPLSVLSPDGRLLASGGSDNTLRLREPSGRVLRNLVGHTAPVQAMAFSPDGRTLASGSGDSTVRLWDIATGRELRRLEGNLYPVWTVAFSPDGRTLASGGSDALVHLWDWGTGRELRRLEAHAGSVRAVATSADGRLLASGGEDGIISLWEPGIGHFPRRLEGHVGPVHSVAFSPDGSLLLSGGGDHTVRLWNTGNGQPLQRLGEHKGPVRAVAFSPDGLLLASGGDDGVVLRELPGAAGTPSGPRPLRGHDGPVRAVAFSPDGKLLASGGDDRTVRLWDTRTGGRQGLLRGHSGPVWAVAFSPDRRTLASAGGDKRVLLWRPGVSSPQRTLEGHTGWVSSLAFSPDGLGLASGDDAGVVRLWSLQGGPPARGALRGARQGWVSHLAGQRVLRHDDGSLLTRAGEGGALEPVPPPRLEPPPRLTSALRDTSTPPGDFGEAGELVLTVSNERSAGRAYWIRVEPVELPPGLLLLAPPPVPRLEAGSSVELRVGLSYLRPEDAPVPQEPRLRLALVDAFGARFPVELESPRLRTPELVLEEPQFEGKTVVVTLRNQGTQPTGKLIVTAEFAGHGLEGGRQLAPELYIHESLDPAEEWPLKISPPARLLEVGRFSLRLAASYERWPRTWEGPTSQLEVPWSSGLFLSLAFAAVVLAAVGGGYYVHVHRSTVVLQVRKDPSSIRRYRLGDLHSADFELRRARELERSLTAEGIPRTRWERALGGARTPRESAMAFAEVIGGKLGSALGSDAWELALPPLRLRFARDTAVVVLDGTRLESGAAERRMTDVFQDGRGPSQVLVLDRTQAQNACQVLQGVPRMRCVVLSADRLRDVLLADEPVRLLESTISEQIAVSELSPYQVAGGVKLEHLFFGREREVRAIVDRAMRNFLVVGQRQMGKSSLLLAVLRRLQARPDLDAHYVELADADVHRRLARERERVPAEGAPLPPFAEVAAGEPSRPRVWLIDEADDFISADARAGYPVLQAMRALAEEGRAYFILAGFWELYRAVVLDEKQPLRNFGEHLRLEPLDERAALALVTEPMAALGLAWDGPSTPEHLLEQAGRRANLLVLACKALVESLPPDTHVLTREHLERVFREDKDLRDQGRRWRGDHPLHRAVVRQALLLGRPTREQVRQALKGRGADLRATDFDEAMDHRELSYVLVPDGEDRLYCPVPLMQRYIEAERGLEAGLVEDLEDLHRRGLSEVPRPA